MSSRDVPEPWASRMSRVGLTDPRNGRPSMSRLADAAGTHPTTISAMMYGTRATTPEVIDKVVAALWPDAVDRGRRKREVHAWVGRALTEKAPFTPHPDVDLLDEKERDAVNEIIRLLAASKKTGQRVLKLEVLKSDPAAPALAAAHEEDTPIDDEAEQTETST